MVTSGSSEQKSNRRSCFLVSAIIAIALLLIIAVGLGLFGQIDRNKNSAIPVLGDNRT